MVSDLVMTEHHTFGRQPVAKSVGLGSYGTDVHEIRRIVKNGVVIREGKSPPVAMVRRRMRSVMTTSCQSAASVKTCSLPLP